MTTQQKIRILFFSTLQTPFIQDDLAFLQKHSAVKAVFSSGAAALAHIVFHGLKSDLGFCWFASSYSALVVWLMKLQRKPSVIIVGGVDVARDLELRYGVWLNPWKSLLVRYALRNASKVLAVDESLSVKAKALAEYDGSNIEVVATGYDSDFWTMGQSDRTIDVLTVAAVDDMVRFRVKGLDLLIEAARLLPNSSFLVIGVSTTMREMISVPANMRMIDAMDRSRLVSYYQSAKIYCQPSRHEGLSNVLCEAMLCGCIPVATDVGGTKNAVGNAGFVVPLSSEHLAAGIQQVLPWPEIKRMTARDRVNIQYSTQQREQTIHTILDSFAP